MFKKKGTIRKIAMLLCLALVLAMVPAMEAKADTGVTAVTPDGGTISLMVGESTQLSVGNSVEYWGQSYSVSRCEFISYDSTIASVDANGKVTALQTGNTSISVSVYTEQNRLFQAEYEIAVRMDLSDIEVDKTSQEGYATEDGYMPEYTFYLKSKEVLTEDWENLVLTYTSSNQNVEVYASLEENVLTITPYDAGKTVVTICINSKEICKLTINTKIVKMNTTSALLSVKQTKQLKVKGCKDTEVTWSSSNPGVVSVTSKGKIKAKKTGNAVIKAQVGTIAFGCAVSAVSKNKKKAVTTAIHIGKTCTYSQPKRMQKNYYDCSSLVWRSYHKNGCNFGTNWYAPVAADLGKWCANKKKMVKGGLSQKNIDSMKLNAGDLMFETGASNGRYRGIYHVEMIVGYNCLGFDYNGKPMLEIKWATRPDGYYGASGEPVARP